MTLRAERAAAVAAVADACRIGEAVRVHLADADTLVKGDASPVTVADFAIQAQATLSLRALLGEVALVGEEEGNDLDGDARRDLRAAVVEHVRRVVPGVDAAGVLDALRGGRHPGGAAGRFWALDPVDGTKGFLRGGQYAVALALIEDGAVVLGVLGCPNLPVDPTRPDGARGCLFVAERGQGVRMRRLDDGAETIVSVSDEDDPTRAVFCESVEAGHSSHDQAGAIAARLGVRVAPVRMDSQVKYAAVARGEASLYLRLPVRADYVEKIWDHAAGSLVVTEAGGRVCDVDGRPLDFARGRTLAVNRGVVATNAHLHETVREAVRAVLEAG